MEIDERTRDKLANVVYERFVVVDCYGNEWIEDFVRKAEEFFGEPPIPYWPIRPQARIRELFRELGSGELVRLLAFISRDDEDLERELNEVLERIGVRLERGDIIRSRRPRLAPLEEAVISYLEALGLDDVGDGFKRAFAHLKRGKAQDAHASVRSSLVLLLEKTVAQRAGTNLRKAGFEKLIDAALEQGVVGEPVEKLLRWFAALPQRYATEESLDPLAAHVGAALALYILERAWRRSVGLGVSP